MKRRSRIGMSLLALSMLCTQATSIRIYAKNNIEPVQQYKLSSLEQAKKNLADFEAKYAKELARLNQGSKGYFEYIGASAAVERVFDKNSSNEAKSDLASYTQMGQKDDATSLENMQASIAYLKECNEIRKKEGLSELKVSTWLMAVAQVNANHAKTYLGHSGTYATSENLAWGYGNANTAGSPFRGWYDEEKAEYLAGNHKFSETGHYQNIVEKQYTITGFAVGTNGQFSTAHCQEFLDDTSDVDGEVVMTVSEFEKSFNNYYGNLKTIDSQHKALQKAVEAQSGKWIQQNNRWWYRHQDGSYTKNNFEQIDGKWYYFDSNGYMITGWKKVKNVWYYFTNTGAMASNQWIGNYYFEASGAMATNKWIGNYHVDANGKWDKTR